MAALGCFGLTRVWHLHEAFGAKPGPAWSDTRS